jgi:hypothetical protein
VVLDEYTREADDYRALHRICSCLEITIRFLAVVILAELWERRASGQAEFPVKFLEVLIRHLERPTLGGWRTLILAALNALPGKPGRKECLLPELPAYVSKFTTALGGGKRDPRDPLKKLLPMRNLLAHNGRISDEVVQKLLSAHAQRFEVLMAGLRFLSEEKGVTLVASPSKGPARLLRGPSDRGEKFDRSRLPEGFEQPGPDRMLLITPNGTLDLCPLHAYGEVFQAVKDKLQGQGEETIQIYSRTAEPAGLEYTALGKGAAYSRGEPAWETRFDEIFQLEAWRARSQIGKYAFQDRMDSLLKRFVGRDQQVEAAAARINDLEGGVLWLAGKPGMGKSAFIAKLARDYFRKQADTPLPRPETICIAYFFQNSQSDLSRTTAFAEAAILQLILATGQTIKPKDDPEEPPDQLKDLLERVAAAEAKGRKRKIVILLDGLDEVVEGQGRLIDLIFGCQYPGLVWVCGGKDQEALRRQFRRDRCGWFFERDSPFGPLRVETAEVEGLLPPLKSDDVRAYFFEELGHRGCQGLINRDEKKADGFRSNDYVDEVIQRSQGLPLYLRLLVEEILARRVDFAPGSELRLPRGLDEYYDRMLGETDLATIVPAITCLLAFAAEPLPLETLAVLLADHHLVRRRGGRDLLEKALRYSGVILRQALTSTSVLGYALYHESLKQHILNSVSHQWSLEDALDCLCNLARNWSKLEAHSAPLDYAFRYGPRMLSEARRWEELSQLLLSFDWMQAKLQATDAYALVADYGYRPEDADLQTLQSVLRQSAHILAANPRELPGQLLGRLPGHLSQDIDDLLKEASEHKSFPWLRPLSPSLNPLESSIIRVLPGHTAGIFAVALTPDGRRAVSGSHDNTLRVWDLESGQTLRTLQGHSWINAVALTPDGRRVVSGGESTKPTKVSSEDNTLRVWDLESGQTLRTLQGHTAGVNAVALTPDGRRVVSSSHDNTLRVWNLEDGKELVTFTIDVNVTSCGAALDNRIIVAGDWLGRVHFLRLEGLD